MFIMQYRPALLALGLATALSGPARAEFRLHSPELQPGGELPAAQVFQGFGCVGGNRSPALAWSGAPAGTQSYAVTVYDPDAPTGSGWWHWLVFNLPATAQGLPADAGNPARGLLGETVVQSRSDFGQAGFGGACPPPGDRPHRYIFTVYALKLASLPLDATAPAAMVGFYIQQNKLAEASVTLRYGR